MFKSKKVINVVLYKKLTGFWDWIQIKINLLSTYTWQYKNVMI